MTDAFKYLKLLQVFVFGKLHGLTRKCNCNVLFKSDNRLTIHLSDQGARPKVSKLLSGSKMENSFWPQGFICKWPAG